MLAQRLNWLNNHPWLLILLVVWSLVFKGLALWRAARRGSRGWFIALLAINTFGLLEIIYLNYFSVAEVGENQ